MNHRLKLLIKSKRTTQSEFARMLDVTRASVNQWLSGKLVPGHKPMMKIFEIYPDVSADWLLLGRGDINYGNNTDASDNTFLKRQLTEQNEVIKLLRQLIDEKDARLKLLENILTDRKK